MNVLFTVSTYYPKKDGVQNVTGYLAEGLAKRGHNVTVITSNKDVEKEFEEHNGVKIIRVDLYTKFGLYLGNKKKYRKLIAEETNKCDVMINVCTQNAFTDVILKSIDNYKCKKILYLHGIFDFNFHLIDFSSFTSLINKLWKEIRWFFYYSLNGKYFKKYDCVTQLHDKDYGNIFFKKKYNIDSVIIGNAADNDFFEKKTIVSFEKPFDKYLIYVANYDDNKNQKLAVEAFFKSNINKKIGLVLMGSSKNNYYDYLKKYISKLRLKYKLSENEKPIKLLYKVDRKMVSSYISNAYLSLMTSKSEKYPMFIVESMSCGTPYICTDVGIVSCFPCGIVSNKKNINYWIEYFVNDESFRNKKALSCENYSKMNFRVDDKVSELESIINKITQ